MLMRTRFSAYAKGKVDYIVRTTHRDNPAQVGSVVNGKQLSTFRADVKATCKRVKFSNLKILDEKLSEDGLEAFVEFTCTVTVTGQKGSRGKGETMQEKSRFVMQDGTWSYIDGDVSWA